MQQIEGLLLWGLTDRRSTPETIGNRIAMHQCISSFLRSLQRQMQRTKPHTLQFDPIRSHPTTPCPVPNNTPRHMNEAKVKRTNIFQNLLQGSKVKGQSMLSNVRIRGGHSRLTETHERRTRSCKRMMKYTMHTRTRHEREVKLNSKESKTKDRMKSMHEEIIYIGASIFMKTTAFMSKSEITYTARSMHALKCGISHAGNYLFGQALRHV